jgi:type IV pilus assembly protein PilW
MIRSSGITLIEVMVAMLLVLVVSAGALAFVARGRDAHRAGESLARLEETLDAAFILLVDEVLVSGYLGLAPPGTPVAGATPVGTAEPFGLEVAGACGPSLAHDIGRPITAADGAYLAMPGGIPIGCRASPGGRLQAGADTLIIRRASGEAVAPATGRLQLETNLRAAALRADGASQMGPAARWHDLEVGVYYVSADSTGRAGFPSLRRKRLVGGARPAFQDEELVSGISDLQLEFGLDDVADFDLAVDRWTAPAAAPVDGIARALRIELEARSDVVEASQPGGRRKRVSRVIELRNGGQGS